MVTESRAVDELSLSQVVRLAVAMLWLTLHL